MHSFAPDYYKPEHITRVICITRCIRGAVHQALDRTAQYSKRDQIANIGIAEQKKLVSCRDIG